MKYLKFIIIFVLILIILTIVALVVINGNSQNGNQVPEFNISTSNTVINNAIYSNNISSNNAVTTNSLRDGEIIDGTVKHLSNYNMFFTIQDAIQNYINTSTVSVNTKFRAVDMNYVSGVSINQYGVYGNLLEGNGNVSDVYYIVNMNMGSLKCSIIPQNSVSSLSSLKLKTPSENEITDNSYQAKFVNATDDVIINRIMDDYKYMVLNYPQTSFKMLDESYRLLRFKDYADYLEFIKNSTDKIRNLEVLTYNSNTLKTEYIVTDNHGNYYKIKLTGLMDYTIILDDYTLSNSSYSSLSEEEKVKYNVKTIIKMINTYDYTNLYYKLNSTFKSNNFSTQSAFENYLKTNYNDYNIIDSIVVNKDNSGAYVCSVKLKKEAKVAANTVSKTIIIKLDGGSNFEFSLGM